MLQPISTLPTAHQAFEQLLDCFRRHDTEGYFACFHPEARFMFYTVPGEVLTKAEYRLRWQQWEQTAGFRVLDCVSSGAHISHYGDCAVVTHEVSTRLGSDDGEQTVQEQESIVFQRQPDGRWLCIHEHLSPLAVGL